jgi:enoyl-CoA hydratase/carnithine racemase
MSDELVLLETRPGGVALLRLDRPPLNALSTALLGELEVHATALGRNADVKAVVVTGSERAFAAGADVSEFTEAGAATVVNAGFRRALDALAAIPRPVIAAVNGFALGGGLELALACDLRVASKAAKVGLPEVTLGIYPAAGGTWRLPRIVGMGRAKELVFTGRIADAAEADGWGLFERFVEADALKAAFELAAQIALNSPLAVQVAKVSLNGIARGDAATWVERLGQAVLFDSPDKQARMTAFLEKRKK